MADKKVSQFEARTDILDTDLIPLVRPTVAASLQNSYILGSNLRDAMQYPEVNTFGDLPAAASYAGEIYIVLQGSGVYLVNRKQAGMYYSDGATWTRLGNNPAFFDDLNFRVYNNSDNTKKVAISAAGITTGTTRTLTVQDKDGTIALLSDLGGSRWEYYATNVQYTGAEEAITGGDVLTCVLDGTTYYRFISSTNTVNGYPDEDAFYSAFTSPSKPTGLIAERGQP